MSDAPPFCPSCGASIGGAASCPACKSPTVAVRHGQLTTGSRFAFPKRCSCCLVATDRHENQSKMTQIGNQRRTTSLAIPKCKACSWISALSTVVRALGWFSIIVWGILAFSNSRPEPSPELFWAGWLGSLVVAYVVTMVLPPWRRAGHTRGCNPVKLTHSSLRFHNRHFASLTKSQ